MKIYRIDVDPQFRPDHQEFVWPPQNRVGDHNDRGVENDFDEWLLAHPNLMCDNPKTADWVYAPIFFNRYFFANLDADDHWGGGLEALGKEVERCREYGKRVFTIAEADVRVIKPSIDFGDMTIFCASRRDDNPLNIDIPLLAAPHNLPRIMPPIKYLACFLGNLATDGVRMQMRDALAHRTDCKVEHANYGEDYYAMTMLESYIALAPRGQGAQSFRMYEAMALGTIPLYISDIDCRPFKQWIDWGNISYYCRDATDVNDLLDSIVGNAWYAEELMEMGARAKDVYDSHLAYNKWCKWAIAELEQL